MATGMNFDLPGYSGALYTTSITTTPFLNLIGEREFTKSVEFAVNQNYSLRTPKQPEISEKASLNAPEADNVARTQETNVTQIFQETVSVSYAHESNMGQLSGINNAGQVENPTSELQFQTSCVMKEVRNDVEYTCINGKYQKATGNTVANKTRGILEAIVTNAVKEKNDVSSSTVRSILAGFFKTIWDAGLDLDGYVLLVNSDIKAAISEAYEGSGYFTPGVKEAGINIQKLITDYGTISVALSRTMPQKTALCFNPVNVHLVEQITPNKGNFFLEPLSKKGASYDYQLFGQIGLDYGFEKLHGKLTFGAT